MHDRVYRICEAHVWAQAQAQGELPLSELDRRDGYVHLSTARQVRGTLQRFFAGRGDLVLLTIDPQRLVDGSLIFEAPSHAHELGLLFPHFYGRVPAEAVLEATPLALDSAGRHVLPTATVGGLA